MAQSFADTMTQTMALYRDGSFAEAYTVLTQHGDSFPDQAPMILYLRSCLAARIEQPELAIDLLREAVEHGFWYNEQIMRESPSWQALQGLPAFERLADVCKTRQVTAEAETRSQLLIAEPEQGCTTQQPCPLALAFHGNGDNAANALDGWRAFAKLGWLLAAVQSSQIISSGAFVWNDQALARTDIEQQYARLKQERRIDPHRSVLVGFSMGAQTALRLALSQAIPAQGFICLARAAPEWTISTHSSR